MTKADIEKELDELKNPQQSGDAAAKPSGSPGEKEPSSAEKHDLTIDVKVSSQFKVMPRPRLRLSVEW